jgi:hypothetical protein
MERGGHRLGEIRQNIIPMGWQIGLREAELVDRTHLYYWLTSVYPRYNQWFAARQSRPERKSREDFSLVLCGGLAKYPGNHLKL